MISAQEAREMTAKLCKEAQRQLEDIEQEIKREAAKGNREFWHEGYVHKQAQDVLNGLGYEIKGIDSQIEGYSLELSVWDEATKKAELKAIKNLNMLDFGFNLDEMYDLDAANKADSEDSDGSGETEDTEDDGGYYGDERERTFNAYNLGDYDPEKTVSPYDLPTLKKCDYIPQALMGFNEVLTTKDFTKGVHFFIDDYQFERIWASPDKYIFALKDFPCVLTPDFSLYTDMPMALKIYNVYRSRLIGQKMQSYGLNVVPTLQYAGPETHSWCFEGIEGGGTVAVSTVGVMRDKESFKIWSEGMKVALEKIQPKTVVCYGTKPDFDFGGVETVFIHARKFD